MTTYEIRTKQDHDTWTEWETLRENNVDWGHSVVKEYPTLFEMREKPSAVVGITRAKLIKALMAAGYIPPVTEPQPPRGLSMFACLCAELGLAE